MSENAAAQLWRVNLVSGLVVIATAGLALTQPLLGVAVVFAAASYLGPAVVLSLIVVLVHRDRSISVRGQVVLWVSVFVFSGLVYALASMVLGEVIGESTGFQVYPFAWVCTAPFAAVYVGVSYLTARHRSRRAAPSV